MAWGEREKRRYKRGDIHCRVFAYVAEPRVIGAFTENVSEGGLRAILDEKLQVSSIINLELFLHDDPTICKGKVVWVKPIKSSEYPGLYFFDTGIEFLRE